MAIPKPEPRDWQVANARELQATDREVLAMLRDSKKRVDKVLAELPTGGASEVRRAQLEQTRARLLAEQSTVFERLGDIVAARRARSAARSAQLSAAADAALLATVGKGAQGQYLYESAREIGQRAIDTALARMRLSELPLSQRIYRSGVWMGGRLNKLINETLASGTLNAAEFARRARDWFNPNTPGGVRYAALRLARTEINNAFHAMSAEKYAATPWIERVDWNLSKSHPKPDICNTVHAGSPYPSDKVPVRPHPQCMCYITPKSVDEDEFIDRFVAGEFDEYLDAELERNGWQEPEPPARPIATGVPVRPAPLRGDAAHAIVPKGLFKRGTLTPNQRKALKTYESGWFMGINNMGREGRENDPHTDKFDIERAEYIRELDGAMAESILNQPIEAYRGLFRARKLFGDRMDNDLTGFSWQDGGFGSITTEERIADLFNVEPANEQSRFKGQNVKMMVRVAAGIGALETSTSAKGSKANGPQAEITLQRKLVWRVVKDNGYDANGVRRLEVEVDRVAAEAERTGSNEGAAE